MGPALRHQFPHLPETLREGGKPQAALETCVYDGPGWPVIRIWLLVLHF